MKTYLKKIGLVAILLVSLFGIQQAFASQLYQNQYRGMDDGTGFSDNVTLRQVTAVFKVASVSLTATGQTTIIPAQAGAHFVPLFVLPNIVRLQTFTSGALTTPAIVRVGNNGSFDNVSSLTTLTGLNTVDKQLPMIIPANLNRLDISSNPIKVDVQTAATGPTGYSATFYIFGIIEN